MNHTKPTPEELQNDIDNAAKELEGMEEKDKLEPAEDKPIDDTPAPPAEDTPASVVEDKPQEDYKKKFIESSREAQILYAKNKKLTEVIDQASGLDEVTEDELKKQYTDWEVMTDTEKRLAKETSLANKRFSLLHEANREFKDIDNWVTKVDVFISDPKSLVSHPELEGKLDEFKTFAAKPSRRNVDFEDLVPAFLYDASKQVKSNKGGMFETGTGGSNERIKPKSDKITLEEASKLRVTNYAKYKEYLIAGKIDDTI